MLKCVENVPVKNRALFGVVETAILDSKFFFHGDFRNEKLQQDRWLLIGDKKIFVQLYVAKPRNSKSNKRIWKGKLLSYVGKQFADDKCRHLYAT